MKAFRDYSLGVKFLSTIVLTTVFAATLMAGSLFFRELAVFTESTEEELAGLSRVIGANCSSALVFDQPDAAQDILSSLNHRPKVLAAVVYDVDGAVFAEYTREDRSDIILPAHPPAPGGHMNEMGDIEWVETIRDEAGQTGSVYILGDRTLFFQQIKSRLAILLITLLPALTFGMIFLGLFLHRVFKRPVMRLAHAADEVTRNNDYSIRARKIGNDELGHLVDQFNLMLSRIQRAHGELDQRGQVLQRELSERTKAERELRSLTETLEERIRERTRTLEAQTLMQTRLSDLSDRMRGQSSVNGLGEQVLSYFSETFSINLGAFYLVDEHLTSGVVATYAASLALPDGKIFPAGEGLVGQVAQSKVPIRLDETPDDYLQVTSGLGNAKPGHVLLHPICHENRVIGILEIASFEAFSDTLIEFIEHAEDAIGVNLSAAHAQDIKETLLAETRKQAQVLQRQQNELQTTNDELADKALALETSRKELQNNQEKLTATNNTLEERQKQLEVKAEELSAANRYKSEFLANMSHELRTPLNSMLILSQMLSENRSGNLSDKETEYARTVHQAGSDLLILINDILDLSKMEAGHLTPEWAEVEPAHLAEGCNRHFSPIANEKGIEFETFVAPDLPEEFISDQLRLEQILRNLISNAVKFTARGHVTLRIEPAGKQVVFQRLNPDRQPIIAFSVNDTGIGIAPEKQRAIFQSFIQADGTTSRKYGGTGLGLSISREFTRLLGGEMHLDSEEGKGSTFTLYLPVRPADRIEDVIQQVKRDHTVRIAPEDQNGHQRVSEGEPAASDGRTVYITPNGNADTSDETAQPSDTPDDTQPPDAHELLIVEDDAKFAALLADRSRAADFEPLIASTGNEGFILAVKHRPHAILLDIHLPDIDGRALIERLADHPETRHIPVHAMSVNDYRAEVTRLGAVGFSHKPTTTQSIDEILTNLRAKSTKKQRRLLLVEDEETQRNAILASIRHNSPEVEIITATNEEETLAYLAENNLDCMILDLKLERRMSGLHILETVAADPKCNPPPVIVYTGIDLSEEEKEKLGKLSKSIVIKGADSEARLLNEVTLFLHQPTAELPRAQQKTLHAVQADKYENTGDRTVLVVDDDSRNVFAVTHILERSGLEVEQARNGIEALRTLEEHPDIDLVLMDIMMPEMDGYQATREIRKQEKFHDLPIIAVTAKAMEDDRRQCMDAGANDYMTKPIDVDRLLSLLHVWLP